LVLWGTPLAVDDVEYCTNTTKSSLDFERDSFDQVFISSRVLVTRDGPKSLHRQQFFGVFTALGRKKKMLEDLFHEISLHQAL
jgi:hypothetical protein